MAKGNLIYHYCGSQAFVEIVQSGLLWASDITKLNDPSEKKLASDIIQCLARKHSVAADYGLFEERVQGVYVCSFSKEDDLLSQWRAYAEDGEGFSLGFDRDALKSIDRKELLSSTRNRIGIELEEVFYDEEEFREYYESYLKEGLKGKFLLGKFEAGSELNEAQGLLKAPFYSEEKEVRAYIPFTAIHDIKALEGDLGRRISTRHTKYGLCSYTFITIQTNTQSSLKHIVLGPKNVNTKVDIEKFLRVNGYNGVTISCSAGQYR